MSGIDSVGTCTRCLDDKKIFFIAIIKRHNQQVSKRSLCKDCYYDMCFCAICLANTTYSDYEQHLLESHTAEEVAKYLLNEKVSSNSL